MKPTLCLVHGYLGGAAQWADQVAAFSDRFDVVALDLPGFGAAADAPSRASIASFADFTLEALSARGVGRFHLLGHSMGGMIAQEIARKASGRIDALILYGTGPVGALPGRFETIATSRARLAQDGVAATAARIAATWFADGADAPRYAMTRAIGEDASIAAATDALTAMEDWDGRAALAALGMRALVLWGDQDRSYAWSQAEALWTGLPQASLAVVPGAAHAVHLEKPALFNAIVEDFLMADRI